MSQLNPVECSRAYVDGRIWEMQKGFVVISERNHDKDHKEVIAVILPRRALTFIAVPEWNKETVINYNGEEHVIKYNESQTYIENIKEWERMKDILARYQRDAIKQANHITTNEITE